MNAPIDISTVTLKTERLVLRPWRETDLEDFYEYARADGVGQMAGWLPHKNIEESATILQSFIARKKTFAIEFRGKAIGSLGIEYYNQENYPELADLYGREIGYVLSRDYWGQGLMPEAVKAVIEYLFQRENLNFILVGHFDWNTQSARVIEKCGFRYIKTVDYATRYDTTELSKEYILYSSYGAIRQVLQEELEECLSVIHESFQTVAADFALTRENCPKHTSFLPLCFLETQIKWGWLMFGLFAGKQLIGYMSLSKESDGMYELHNLAVLPAYRHKGFGKNLLAFAKETVKEQNGRGIRIGIIEESTILKNWYIANGFVHMGTKKYGHLPFTSGYLHWSCK